MCEEIKTKGYARRKFYVVFFGQGFNSPRFHQICIILECINNTNSIKIVSKYYKKLHKVLPIRFTFMELTRNKFIEILYFFAKLIRKFLKYVISQKNPKQKIKKNKIKKIFIAKFIKFKKNYKSIIC